MFYFSCFIFYFIKKDTLFLCNQRVCPPLATDNLLERLPSFFSAVVDVNEPAVEALVAGHHPGDPDLTVTQMLEPMSIGPEAADLTWYTNSFGATLPS
mmetsp:Transcript_8071/g.22565  ORF Transcript_8071/g.22565 Transcript_8071/m.22565 type:complete len:98 (+) Transcript_8071:102-395(+)